MTRTIRRDRGFSTDKSAATAGTLAQAIQAKTQREYLLGFDPGFDGRDDNVVTEVTLSGNGMKFIDSPTAGKYWQAFHSVDGGQVQIVIRGLPATFRPEKRNTFRGLTRVARKTDLRKGDTVIVTIKVSEEALELTHQLKIFHNAPVETPANLLVVETYRGAVAILELPRE